MQDVLYYARKAGKPHMKSVYMLMHQRKPDANLLAERVLQALKRAQIAVAAEPWIRERLDGEGVGSGAPLARADGAAAATARCCVPTRWLSGITCPCLG